MRSGHGRPSPSPGLVRLFMSHLVIFCCRGRRIERDRWLEDPGIWYLGSDAWILQRAPPIADPTINHHPLSPHNPPIDHRGDPKLQHDCKTQIKWFSHRSSTWWCSFLVGCGCRCFQSILIHHTKNQRERIHQPCHPTLTKIAINGGMKHVFSVSKNRSDADSLNNCFGVPASQMHINLGQPWWKLILVLAKSDTVLCASRHGDKIIVWEGVVNDK